MTPQFLRFLVVGLVNTAFGYGCFALLSLVGANDAIALCGAMIAGTLFNFKTYGALVFHSNDNRLLLRFVGVYIVLYAINLVALKALEAASIDHYVAFSLLLLPIAVLSFLLNRRFVYASKPPSLPSEIDILTSIDKRDFAAAEAKCKEALQHLPDDPHLNCLLAIVAQHTDQDIWAIGLCQAVLLRNPDYWEANFILALSAVYLQQEENITKALAYLKRSAPAFGDFVTLAISLPSSDAANICTAFAKAVGNPIKLRLHVKSALKVCSLEKIRSLVDVMPLLSSMEWVREKGEAIVYGPDQEKITVRAPPVFTLEGRQPAGPPLTVTGNLPYAAMLRDVTIFSNSSVMITSDGVALSDLATHPRFGTLLTLKPDPLVIKREANQLVADLSGYTVEDHPGGICLSGFVANAYGHFVPEYLSKIMFLENHPDFSSLPLIVDEIMPQSHFDYLSSVVSNPMVRMAPGTALRCARLLVAPTPTFYPYEILTGPEQHEQCLSPRSLNHLRARVMAKIGGESRFSRKIYLSRRNMTWRRLENEEEIQQWLENQGFETVYAEDLSFIDQILMFRNAEMIVAPAGSALLNIIFANTAVRVFVLSSPNTFNWGGFYGPMSMLGYDIIFVTGQQTTDYKHADYGVPLDCLRKVIGQDHT